MRVHWRAPAARRWRGSGLYGFAWNDYETEARPAFEALVHGHVLEFLRLAPAYGGSLVERAPFALLPGLWGGGQLAVYRMVALPCLLATAALGVWLVARMRAQGRSTLARAVALGVCVANPLTLRALELGHPEELLGGCLCVAAVLLAAGRAVGRDRALGPASLLGWRSPTRSGRCWRPGRCCWRCRRAQATGACSRAAARSPQRCSRRSRSSARAASSASTARGRRRRRRAIFQPWQVWWFFGHHGALVHGLFGAPKPGYRIGRRGPAPSATR